MVTCNGGCWAYCQSTTGFPDEPTVAQYCRAWGGLLAPIRDAADEDCVSQMVFPNQASWIGFQQAPAQVAPTVGWSWNSDGVVATYTQCGGGEPNDVDTVENDEQDCAAMNTAGNWYDWPCTGQAYYRYSCRR